MSKSDVDGVCENLEACKLDVGKKISDEELFKQPPPLEDCPICFERIPTLHSGCKYHSCCGKRICSGCVYAPVYDHQGNKVIKKCPFCRTPKPKSNEDYINRMKKRADAEDPIAIYNTGNYYRNGKYGFPQDYTKALELLYRAGELGYAKAYTNIGYLYEMGIGGVEVNMTKARHYYELSAMGGNEVARNNLGNNEWRAGNMDRAIKHYMIAVKGGDSYSLNVIKEMYTHRDATKDDYTAALRLYQSYLGEIKSRQRDEAAAFHSEKYQYY